MKRFKTTREKDLAQQEELKHLLAEKNLLKNVFVDYSRVPIGILAAVLMLLVSFLTQRPLTSLENMLFVYQGIGGICFFYTFQTWYAYHQERQRLQHTRNAFIGRGIYPLLFGLSFIYLLWPLGLPSTSLGGLVVFLSLIYPLKWGEKSLKDAPFLRHQTIGLVILLLLNIPLVAPAGSPNVMAAGSVVGIWLLISGLNFFQPHWMHLEKPLEKTAKA